jgi:hypothetical protein
MEARLAQLEVLPDQNRSDGRAATVELCSLGTTVNHQPDTSLSDARSANSNRPEIRTKIRVNISQIYHYSNRL